MAFTIHLARTVMISLLLVLSSCTYLDQRAADFLDCFHLSTGIGVGTEINMDLLFIQVGAGYWEGREIGLFGERHFCSCIGKYFSIPIPFCFLLGPLLTEIVFKDIRGDRPPSILSKFMITGLKKEEIDKSMEIYSGNILQFISLYSRNINMNNESRINNAIRWTDWFWVRARVSFFIKIEVGFNVAEFVDFILGFFGIDIGMDDKRNLNKMYFKIVS